MTFTIEEVKRLRDLYIELMEAVTHVAIYLLEYARKYNIPLPQEEGLINLLGHVSKLVREMNEENALPPNFQHRFRTPKDSTEPPFPFPIDVQVSFWCFLVVCGGFTAWMSKRALDYFARR